MIKSLRDVIGFPRYKRLNKTEDGKTLSRLLERYGKIATGTASDDAVQATHDFIESGLPFAFTFYDDVAKGRTGQISEQPPETKLRHQAVANVIKKLQSNFKSAKTRIDKIINIDNFMQTAHTHGGNIVVRLWQYPESPIGDENMVIDWLYYLREAKPKENPRTNEFKKALREQLRARANSSYGKTINKLNPHELKVSLNYILQENHGFWKLGNYGSTDKYKKLFKNTFKKELKSLDVLIKQKNR